MPGSIGSTFPDTQHPHTEPPKEPGIAPMQYDCLFIITSTTDVQKSAATAESLQGCFLDRRPSSPCSSLFDPKSMAIAYILAIQKLSYKRSTGQAVHDESRRDIYVCQSVTLILEAWKFIHLLWYLCIINARRSYVRDLRREDGCAPENK